jgi:hypothetical protein
VRASAALAFTLAAAGIGAPAAAAAGTPVGLPSPSQQLTASPPLQGNVGLAELRLPGRVSSRQRVLVGLGPDGAPVSIEAVQRLTLHGTGDYAFVVPAPLTDVGPAPGTDTQPGFRRDAIIWQGFSPGRRVLAAKATLRVHDARSSLPILVSLRATVDGLDLRSGERRSGRLAVDLTLENRTSAPNVTFRAEGVPIELAGVLDGLRNTIEHDLPFFGYVATLRSKPETVTARFDSPLHLAGMLHFPHGHVTGLRAVGGRVVAGGLTFAARLGDGAPLRYHVHLEGRASGVGPPSLAMRVDPVLEVAGLRPPRGRNWTQAISRHLVPVDGRSMLSTTIGALLRVSRARQYEVFLADPDALIRAGQDRTVYLYATAAVARAVPAPAHKDGGGVLVPLLAALGGTLLAGGLAVVWAHS